MTLYTPKNQKKQTYKLFVTSIGGYFWYRDGRATKFTHTIEQSIREHILSYAFEIGINQESNEYPKYTELVEFDMHEPRNIAYPDDFEGIFEELRTKHPEIFL